MPRRRQHALLIRRPGTREPVLLIQPPLYDYFPCMGRTCPIPGSPSYNPCVGPYPYQCPLCDGNGKSLRCGANGCTPVW